MRFIDTNIFLRFFTGDDPVKAAASKMLLERVDRGEETAVTSESALVEVVFLLHSSKHYAMSRSDVAARILSILEIPNLRIDTRPQMRRACELFAGTTTLDIADALSIAYMEQAGVSEIYSYDHDFDAVPGVTRVEP